MKRLLILFFLIISSLSFSQERNTEVRKLNTIVSYMDEFSRMEQTAYFDVLQLAKAIHQSCEKINPNYFYSNRSKNEGRSSYSGMETAFRFKELKPFPDKSLPTYMIDWIPYLEAREKVVGMSYGKPGTVEISTYLQSYIRTADSLFEKHNELTSYIADKRYLNDSSFEKGKQLLQDQSRLFESCHSASARLYKSMKAYFEVFLPSNDFHPELKNALAELKLTTDLLDNWQAKLYKGDQSVTAEYDRQLRSLNEQGLSRDSIYLFKTKGYGKQNSGWWAHTRYSTFYTSMQSGLYWYASAKIHSEDYLDNNQQYYNGFINGYNSAIEDYNDFTAIMDGKSFRGESSCCLGPDEIDLHENVMLKIPRLLYQYKYIDPCKLAKVQSKDSMPISTVNSSDLERVQHADPHHLIYLLDVSGSMHENGKIEALKESAKYLVGLQDSKDRISVVRFAEHEDIVMENVSCSDKKDINERIDQLTTGGSTNIKAGAKAAVRIGQTSKLENGKTKIILITDGIFELDSSTKALINSLSKEKVAFSVLYLGKRESTKYENQLKKLCESTNGNLRYVTPETFSDALLNEATE